MNLNSTEGWEKPHTTTDSDTYYLEDEPRRVFWHIFSEGTLYSEEEPRSIHFLPVPLSNATPQDEEETEYWNVLSKRMGSVATRLRNLPADAPYSNGLSWQDFQNSMNIENFTYIFQ